MNVQDIIYPIGHLLEWTFTLLGKLGDYPNTGMIVLGFFGIALWLRYQKKYTDKAIAEGGLK